jgi:Phage integrase, N-terminal SAM-like domain
LSRDAWRTTGRQISLVSLAVSPDTPEAEDLRRYQLYLVDQGVSSTTLNAIITGLRFFFEVTLDRPVAIKKMRHKEDAPRL